MAAMATTMTKAMAITTPGDGFHTPVVMASVRSLRWRRLLAHPAHLLALFVRHGGVHA
jgi:hypothetical protein